MQTIKTAVVVVLLLFVLYGGYVAMNGTDTPLKPELENLLADQSMPDVSGPAPIPSSGAGTSASGFDMFSKSTPQGFPSSGLSTNTSPFANNSISEGVPPISAFPNSNTSAGLQPAPLLSPATTSPIPSLPQTLPSPSQAIIPSLSASSTQPPSLDRFPTSGNDSDSVPSTKNPGFDAAIADNKLPDFQPSGSNPSVKPLDLPNESNVPSLGLGSEPSSGSVKSSVSKSYENAKDVAMEQIDRRNLKDALATLSVFYNAPELTTEQRQDLLDLLDALSREVVYSRSHLLDMAYVVAPGETLEQVAKRYDLPPEILARINSLDTTTPLRSGEKLKVVPGPFRAEIDIPKNELTMFLGDLYAGRYPVTFGAEPSPKPGVFQVVEKQKNRNYYGNGVQIQANDPRNPFGGYWIDLGQDLCIHGSSSGGSVDNKLGCISLSPMDANDVFGMLGRGSQVTIRR